MGEISIAFEFLGQPEVVIDYVRGRFAVGNAKITDTIENKLSVYEETFEILRMMARAFLEADLRL